MFIGYLIAVLACPNVYVECQSNVVCLMYFVQYKTEKDGVLETRVEHKVVLSSTDDDFDHDSVGCLDIFSSYASYVDHHTTIIVVSIL